MQPALIASLNTRVRRLRYVWKLLEIVSEAPLSRQLVTKELTDYALSKSLYEDLQSTQEPSSGHFFENIAWTYERNIQATNERRISSSTRVAEAYINFAVGLNLLIEQDGRLHPSLTSLPLRFLLSGSEWKKRQVPLCAYMLALLVTFDRDQTCPLLWKLDLMGVIDMKQVESDWSDWSQEWLQMLIAKLARGTYGNPSPLLKYLSLIKRSRLNPKRYAEHTALIRLHWLIDLGFVSGTPERSPSTFKLVPDYKRWVSNKISSVDRILLEGDVTQLYFCLLASCAAPIDKPSPSLIVDALNQIASHGTHRKMGSLRADIVDASVLALSPQIVSIVSNYDELSGLIDKAVVSLGFSIVAAPNRSGTYILLKP